MTAGGVWTDGSSGSYKEKIRDLTLSEASATLRDLEPRKFSYKLDPEETYLGFIAEDAPELVATQDRKGLSPMDFVALLVKVVQDQQDRVEKLEDEIHTLAKRRIKKK